ncbi:hypothetical protein DAI22_05g112801 [Oryza sativa Japonica Group]|nr:hypothetical protein DAI22_05g112801 [Oryza sativa Japonica Group]
MTSIVMVNSFPEISNSVAINQTNKDHKVEWIDQPWRRPVASGCWTTSPQRRSAAPANSRQAASAKRTPGEDRQRHRRHWELDTGGSDMARSNKCVRQVFDIMSRRETEVAVQGRCNRSL